VKHEPACKKLTKMQRKIFDSGKQRATGTEIPLAHIKKAQKEREKAGGFFPRPKTHWRERHEDFINAVSASRQVEHALKTGAPLPPPPKTSMNSDYIQCDFCGRNFNRHAAERHIPFCEEQNKRRGTTAKPQTRSASLSRAARRSSDQPPTTSSTKRSSRENSVSRGAPGSRRSSQERPPATGKSSRPNANSATLAPRSSQLPTPVK
uniref:Zinc finger C2HC domain-containing protein 1B n=1 Tax=Acrobeloides nanus TaxID=290746 RepID=A0A914D1D7_9BILA